jgi:hypothetical protein
LALFKKLANALSGVYEFLDKGLDETECDALERSFKKYSTIATIRSFLKKID